MPEASIDYPVLLRRAFLGVVRDVLARTAEEGLPGEHHFFLELLTGHPGVELPAFLRRQHPETLQIVLQHQFADLAVDDEGFAVTLRFDGKPAHLRVPFEALVQFVDPAAEFALRLPPGAAGASAGEGPGDEAAPPVASEGTNDPPPDNGGTVLPFPRRAED